MGSTTPNFFIPPAKKIIKIPSAPELNSKVKINSRSRDIKGNIKKSRAGSCGLPVYLICVQHQNFENLISN